MWNYRICPLPKSPNAGNDSITRSAHHNLWTIHPSCSYFSWINKNNHHQQQRHINDSRIFAVCETYKVNFIEIQYYPRVEQTAATYTAYIYIRMHNRSIKRSRLQMSPGTSGNANTHSNGWSLLRSLQFMHFVLHKQCTHCGDQLEMMKCDSVAVNLKIIRRKKSLTPWKTQKKHYDTIMMEDLVPVFVSCAQRKGRQG